MSKQRMEEIDGLRGLAALSVMLGHWGEEVKKHAPPVDWEHLLQGLFLDYWSFGRLAIVAFFCISGFVVPFSFRGERPMVSFPISRMARLYPAYWVSVLLATLVFAMFPVVGVAERSTRMVLANLTMVQFALREPTILGVYWTLWIELVFYAICYAMFGARLLHNARANFAMMCLFLGIALIGGFIRWNDPANEFPIGIPTYLAAMHFGTIARLRMLDPNRDRNRIYPTALAVLLIGVLTANTSAYLHAQNELIGWVGSNTAYLAGVGLFLGCIHFRWFRAPWIVFSGLISYSLYLFHMIFIKALGAIWPTDANWFGTTALYTTIYFALTIAVAIVVQRFVERPSIGIGRRIENAVLTSLRGRTARA